MWSNLFPSNHQASHGRLYVQRFTSFAGKHRVMSIVFIIAASLATITGVFVLQSAEATQRAKQQTISQTQPVVSTTTNTTSEQPTVVDEQKTSEQPTQNNTSVSRSDTGSTVTVNNETIQLPANGSVQRTIQDDDGTTQVNVSVNSNSSGSNTSFNSTSINSNSSNQSSQSSISINNSQ